MITTHTDNNILAWVREKRWGTGVKEGGGRKGEIGYVGLSFSFFLFSMCIFFALKAMVWYAGGEGKNCPCDIDFDLSCCLFLSPLSIWSFFFSDLVIPHPHSFDTWPGVVLAARLTSWHQQRQQRQQQHNEKKTNTSATGMTVECDKRRTFVVVVYLVKSPSLEGWKNKINRSPRELIKNYKPGQQSP